MSPTNESLTKEFCKLKSLLLSSVCCKIPNTQEPNLLLSSLLGWLRGPFALTDLYNKKLNDNEGYVLFVTSETKK